MWDYNECSNFFWEVSVGPPFGIEILNIIIHISRRYQVRGTDHIKLRCTLLLVI